jgi:hypothetical protein
VLISTNTISILKRVATVYIIVQVDSTCAVISAGLTPGTTAGPEGRGTASVSHPAGHWQASKISGLINRLIKGELPNFNPETAKGQLAG